jgi:hypothetical protein
MSSAFCRARLVVCKDIPINRYIGCCSAFGATRCSATELTFHCNSESWRTAARESHDCLEHCRFIQIRPNKEWLSQKYQRVLSKLGRYTNLPSEQPILRPLYNIAENRLLIYSRSEWRNGTNTFSVISCGPAHARE